MVCQETPNESPTRRESNKEDEDPPVPSEVDYDTALHLAGYGRLSRSALGACACAFFTTGVENCLMSYVLPAARCELQLTTYQAGLINMAFMCGGTVSAFFWGIVGDVFGRRNILSLTLLLNGAITLAQSTVPDYRVLLAARSINGFLIGGPSTLVMTYLSDLVGSKRRELYLSITGMSFVAAWLILPAFAWLIIPFNATYRSLIPVYSWRLYLALSSLPGVISGVWILFLPESPRLLCDTNRSDKALDLLKYIHKVNNGKTSELKINKLIHETMSVGKDLAEEHEDRTKILFLGVLKDLKIFVSRSYALKSGLILFVFFANMAAGFGLNLWIPELLLRMQGRECRFARQAALTETSRFINASSFRSESNESSEIYTSSNGKGNNVTLKTISAINDGPCDDTMDEDVFTSGLIVGACCVLGNAACVFFFARGGGVGVRRAAAACAFACALACACLAACACSCGSSSKIAVAAAAALNAASLNGNVLLIRLLLHALPAKLSGLGVCWGAWWGRSGGVAINFAVGVLLDFSCPAPFITVAALLAVSVGAIMMIKLQDVEKKVPKEEPEDDLVDKNTGLDRYISTHM